MIFHVICDPGMDPAFFCLNQAYLSNTYSPALSGLNGQVIFRRTGAAEYAGLKL